MTSLGKGSDDTRVVGGPQAVRSLVRRIFSDEVDVGCAVRNDAEQPDKVDPLVKLRVGVAQIVRLAAREAWLCGIGAQLPRILEAERLDEIVRLGRLFGIGPRVEVTDQDDRLAAC